MKTNLIKSLFIILLVVSVLIFGYDKYKTYRNLRSSNKIETLIELLEKSYVDTVNRDALMKAAINGMLQYLDPHSAYSDPIENKELKESMEGAFEGIGVQFNIMNDTVMVVATIVGGPSEKVGIKAGDRIVAVNGENIAGVNIQNNRVVTLLRGKKGTKVKVQIKRPNVSQIFEYNIVRDVIESETILPPYKLDKQTGYIKIDQFGRKTGEEFTQALLWLQVKGMNRLVLDLRGNSGGYLSEAVAVCDHFLRENDTILTVEGAHTPTKAIVATDNGLFLSGTVIVLIDEFSASASEIVAGAIQDNDRGWIVGRRSFGKGLVQQDHDFTDGSSVRLTVSRFHTPSGRCIQRDYHNGKLQYYEDILKRYENGELDSIQNISYADSLPFFTKNGRPIYGGGGIMPDCFVPLAKNSYSPEYLWLVNSPKLIQFTFDYTHKYEDNLRRQYPSAYAFVKNMIVSSALVDEYVRFCKQDDDFKSFDISKLNSSELSNVKMWLKALIGRNLYRDEAFYPIVNQTDETIKKAMTLKGHP